ncbi:MAG: hypothetical protein ABIA59_08325 [Candidatus Latescibacterota bacterium]
MKRAFSVTNLVCILLVLGLMIGCSKNSDPVVPTVPVVPDPDLVGAIGVFADEAGTDRNLVDTGGIVTLNVVHKLDTKGATASAFVIDAPAGWVLQGAQVEFPLAIGNIGDGIAIAYGGCHSGNVHLMTLTYLAPGNSPAGSMFRVLPHPHTPETIEVVDCDDLMQGGAGMDSPVIVQ